jgi:hypothetical protein
MSGVLPVVHGIYNNGILDPERLSNGGWYWYARAPGASGGESVSARHHVVISAYYHADDNCQAR